MTQIQEHVSVSAELKTSVAPAKSFGTQLFILDDPQVPIDKFYRLTDSDSYADEYTVGSDIYNYCLAFFGQKRTPESLMIGRFIAADSSPYFVFPDYNADYTDWELIGDGGIKFVSGALNDTVSGLDFDGITAKSQILTILNAGLAGLSSPNITGLDSAVFSFDSLDRLILTMPDTGASAVNISSVAAPATGTDLTGASYLNYSSPDSFAVAGYDAESPVDTIQRILQYTSDFYNVHERDCNAAQQLILAQYIETQEMLLDLVTTNDDAYDATKTTDIGYLIQALSLKRTTVIYTDASTEYPDAANAGCVFPTDEGTTEFAFEELAQITESMQSGGLTKLSLTDKTALNDKGYNYVETVGNITYIYDGMTVGEVEKRIMLGRDWFVARIREAIFTSKINEPLHAFDADTFGIVENTIRTIGNEAIRRKILVNTEARPFTVSLPDPDDITAAEKATHTLTKTEVFKAYLNSSVTDYVLSGIWSN